MFQLIHEPHIMFNRRSFLYSAGSLTALTLLESCSKNGSPTPAAKADIAAWGDSLTEGAGGTPYPTHLGILLADGRTIYNGGKGSYNSTHIVFRMGLTPVTLAVSNNQIPASGPVAVTPANLNILPENKSENGVIDTVDGTLARDRNGSYTFTRTSAGNPVAVPPSSNFVVKLEKKLTDHGIHVLWPGQNDIRSPAGNEGVLRNLAKMVDAVTTAGKAFIVMSVSGADAGPKGTGGENGYNSLIILNNTLKATYPTNFIDIRATLISNYKKDNTQDLADFNNDIIPTSLRSDVVHLNTAGYAVVAKTVMEFISQKNW